MTNVFCPPPLLTFKLKEPVITCRTQDRCRKTAGNEELCFPSTVHCEASHFTLTTSEDAKDPGLLLSSKSCVLDWLKAAFPDKFAFNNNNNKSSHAVIISKYNDKIHIYWFLKEHFVLPGLPLIL